MASHRFDDKRIPVYTIIGGFMYEATPDLGKALRHWTRRYTGENYAYSRLYESAVDGRTYRSAIYTRMPACIFQFEDEAVAIRYSPVVGDQIPSVSVWADGEGCHFEYTDSVAHPMKSKDTPHLGAWQRESVYKPQISHLPEFKTIRAATWFQWVRQFVEAEMAQWPPRLKTYDIQDAVCMANAFHDRMFDALNCVHLETAYSDRPALYSDAIFNNPSFEACRVAALLRYDRANRGRCDRIVRRLVFDETLSAELREVGPYRVWHNGFDKVAGTSALHGVTDYGTGFSGYPGGMATFLRRLLQYAQSAELDDVLPRLRQGVDWLLLVQHEDGSFPFTIPTFVEIGNPLEAAVTGPESKALGGAAEAARALVWAYKVYGDKRYLSAAEKAVQVINPVPPMYAFRGYGDLRDASAYETDATSGIQLSNANLDLFETTGESRYLETAVALGYYLLTWHDWWQGDKIDPYGLIDPMAESFSPHASPWNTSLASELYSRLYTSTGDRFWEKLAEFSFARAVKLQNKVTGGISEAYNIRLADEITTMGGESAMTTWGVLDAGCALLENRKEPSVRPYSPVPTGRPLANGFELSAAVVYAEPPRAALDLKKRIRGLKPIAKRILKSILGVKGVSGLQKGGPRRLSPASVSPVAGKETTVIFRGTSECKEGLNYAVVSGSGNAVIRMSALGHDTRITKVYMPVIDFESEILTAEPIRQIGQTITACSVHLANRLRVQVEFAEGTSGLGVGSIKSEGRRLVCDATLKAGWQFGGECLQILRLTVLGE